MNSCKIGIEIRNLYLISWGEKCYFIILDKVKNQFEDNLSSVESFENEISVDQLWQKRERKRKNCY